MINWPKQRAWGWYATLIRMPWFCLKLLRFKPHGELSMQKHRHRTEIWLFLKGSGMVRNLYDNAIHTRFIESGNARMMTVLPSCWHQFLAGNKPVYALEFQYGRKVTESDIERK